MKGFGIVGAFWCCLMMFSVVSADAQPWRDWKGSGGWGAGSNYQRMYNRATEVTLMGVVESVEQVKPLSGMSYGIHLTIRTDTETLSVHLGPSWFIERQDVVIAVGDSVEVIGSRVAIDGEAAIIAREVRKGEAILELRDENGVPSWAGARMRRR